MRIPAGFFLAVLFLCAFHPSFAQTASSSAVKGKVFAANTAADGATVVLINARDSSVVKSTISNGTGSFSFEHLSAGNYSIFITKLNYGKSYSGPYSITEGKNLDVGVIRLVETANQLKEITITGKKDFIEVRADKTVLNVEQNIMAAGASVYDVLTTSPGVKVTDDEILYHDGQKAMIAVDGKPVLLTGEELVSFLKNYQSSSISQIELIENPGGKYGAAAAGGMINIILKRNKEIGSKVTVIESAGIGDKYKFNTGLVYNLHAGDFNLFASYGWQDNKIPHSIRNNRDILTGGDLYNFNLNYNANIKTVNNNFSVGGDYELSKGQTIGFLVNGFDNNITYDKLNTTAISTNGQLDSTINTQSTIHRDISNVNYNLNYKVNFDKAGNSVLSADGDYTDFHRSSQEILQNTFLNPQGQTDGMIYYQDNSPSHILIKSANIDFSQALSKSSRLGLGVKSSLVNSDNQINFEQFTVNGYVPVPDLTDHFIYNERIDAAYLSFDGKFNNTSLSVSLRGEKTTSVAVSSSLNRRVDSSYMDLFPNVQLSQDFGKNNRLTLRYSRSINRPNYQDLNPFVGYVDQFYYSTGNPYLKPDYINIYEVSDFMMNKYKVSFSTVITDNFFYTVFEQNDLTKVYVTTKANLGTRYQYILKFDAPFDLAPWWHVEPDLSLFHERYQYSLDTVAQKTTNDLAFSLNENFKISNRFSAQLVNYYETPTYFGISQYHSLSYMNAGVSYSILDNKGSIKLAVNDIFNSEFNKYQTTFSNLDITARDKVGTRFVMATFTYHFGTTSAHNHTKNSDEVKRLGNGEEN